ncbi:hypothetical protein MUG78_16865 [Gordonia alkaliphila]|uniref:hypothetical protein n=1 Tax=Gordonia alkaliphila TaxID=1053547 RepID=UPI001FF1BC4D|nr:hypothetical protein [Gordonia alkaliphila]MCK0441073.1 hypothetical protein [Gordonia alkaliphila]
MTSNHEALTTEDVITLGAIVDAAAGGTNVRFKKDSQSEMIAGVARSLTGPEADIRDRSLRINDGVCDVDIPIRDILAAAPAGGFDAGLGNR